ncbi:spore coat-associated protein N [Salinibacillus kushneri]|uniref:Spore coat-associated protein N n=1 Tax=Salinibacillus kushneri TaxID=237682 RepID=A0A1I0JHG5_9BACI|nr:TasA family protein [Salinibacillus kushneri]SEU09542.1 spore coat-associated protein N [Salinibacillus kushneri]
MSLKKKLGAGIAAAALGISLVGGGTFAYFNDTETSNNTFAAGTLDLSMDPQVVFDVGNLKPGDYMIRDFELQNTGSLDIKSVLLDTSYSVIDENEDNGDQDFGEHFVVKFIKNKGHTEWEDGFWDDDNYTVVYQKTLAELSQMTPDDIATELEDGFLWHDYKKDGIPSGDHDHLTAMIEFKDNGEDQNVFQGDTLNLEWTFTAEQEDGEER